LAGSVTVSSPRGFKGAFKGLVTDRVHLWAAAKSLIRPAPEIKTIKSASPGGVIVKGAGSSFRAAASFGHRFEDREVTFEKERLDERAFTSVTDTAYLDVFFLEIVSKPLKCLVTGADTAVRRTTETATDTSLHETKHLEKALWHVNGLFLGAA